MTDDDLPDPLAAFEQGLRALVDVARAVRTYHVALVEQGFTEDQALALALGWQKHALENA